MISLSPQFFDNSTGFRTRLYWAQLITIAIVTPLSFVLNKLWTFSAVRGRAGEHARRTRPPSPGDVPVGVRRPTVE